MGFAVEDLDEDLVDEEAVWWVELVAVVLFLMVLVDLMVLVLVWWVVEPAETNAIVVERKSRVESQ